MIRLKFKHLSLFLFFFLLVCFIVFIFSYHQFNIHLQQQEMERHAKVIENDLWAMDPKGPINYLTLASDRDNYAKIDIKVEKNNFISIKGPIFIGIDKTLEKIGLIPQTCMLRNVIHNGEIIGQLIVYHRNMNIYIYFYGFIFATLIYLVIVLFLKNNYAKHQLEYRVIERTAELKEKIEEQKKTEKELNHLRNYLNNIIDSMPSVLVGVDADIKVTQWNKTAEQITDVAAIDALGKILSDVLPQTASEMKKITESIRTREIKFELKKPTCQRKERYMRM